MQSPACGFFSYLGVKLLTNEMLTLGMSQALKDWFVEFYNARIDAQYSSEDAALIRGLKDDMSAEERAAADKFFTDRIMDEFIQELAGIWFRNAASTGDVSGFIDYSTMFMPYLTARMATGAGVVNEDVNLAMTELMEATPKLNEWFLGALDQATAEHEQYDVVGEMVKENGESEGSFGLVSPGSVIRLSKDAAAGNGIHDQLRAHRDELNSMEPVATIESETTNYSKSVAAQKIFDIFGKNLIVQRPNFGDVYFTKSEISGILNYVNNPAEFAALKCVPSVIKRGKEIEHHTEHKGRGNVEESFTFGAPALINGIRGNIGVVVQKTNHLKAHAVRVQLPNGDVLILDNKKADRNRGGDGLDTVSQSHSASATSIISQDSKIATDFSGKTGNSLVSPTTIEESDALADTDPAKASEVFEADNKEATEKPVGYSILKAPETRYGYPVEDAVAIDRMPIPAGTRMNNRNRFFEDVNVDNTDNSLMEDVLGGDNNNSYENRDYGFSLVGLRKILFDKGANIGEGGIPRAESSLSEEEQESFDKYVDDSISGIKKKGPYTFDKVNFDRLNNYVFNKYGINISDLIHKIASNDISI